MNLQKKQHVTKRPTQTSMLQKDQRTRTRMTKLAQFCSEIRITSTVCDIHSKKYKYLIKRVFCLESQSIKNTALTNHASLDRFKQDRKTDLKTSLSNMFSVNMRSVVYKRVYIHVATSVML